MSNVEMNLETEVTKPAMDAVEMAVESASNPGVNVGAIILGTTGALAATALVVKLVSWGIKKLRGDDENEEDAEIRKPDGEDPVEPTDEQIRHATE